MIVFVDGDFKCHVTDDGSMRAVETDFFDGKCQEYIEGYRFVPSGETWVREDGTAFSGEMISPWKPYSELSAIQTAVDRTQDEADAKQMELLDIIEELILGG